jgi:hypothetical protein
VQENDQPGTRSPVKSVNNEIDQQTTPEPAINQCFDEASSVNYPSRSRWIDSPIVLPWPLAAAPALGAVTLALVALSLVTLGLGKISWKA